MPTTLTCPYCLHRQPLKPGRGAQFCLQCDERLFLYPTYPEYRSLSVVDYAAPPPPVIRIRPDLAPEAPEPGHEAGEDEDLKAALVAFRPWWFSSRLIALLLFTLTPLGIVLLWAQNPRDRCFGGSFSRLLISLLLGPAWLVGAVLYYPALRDAAFQAPLVRQALNPPVATLAEFEQIRSGDTYERVRTLIGADGVVTSRLHMDPKPGLPALDTVVYEWRNPDGGVMNALFFNGALERKTQAGLR